MKFTPEQKPLTLVELLRHRAASQPERPDYLFLVDGEQQTDSFSFAQLDLKARTIAACLQSQGLQGERALLLYSPGLDYIAALFGCFYAGVVAVPVYPPLHRRYLPRLENIFLNSRPEILLTTDSILNNLHTQPDHWQELNWLATDTLPEQAADAWRDPKISLDTLALLQYTSGSTGNPKGVMVTHANLWHNQQQIQAAFQHTPDSIIVGWLPLYHDMGLIGNVLNPLYSGATCVLFPPLAFMERPIRWLKAITTYHATTSGGPNFAYELCVRKFKAEDCAGLDLSSWDLAFNGAEPIRAETLERFSNTFRPYGFRPEAFFPCYGLAEATLFVSGGKKADPPVIKSLEDSDKASSKTLVGCGQVGSGQRLEIVEPETCQPLPPGTVGEVWVSGPNVARGYWEQAAETEKMFKAQLASNDEARFLRTGDLGFVQGGELFITGRLKDLIIIRGRNYYPQDIEGVVQASHPIFSPDSGAAFSVTVAGEERMVVVQQVERHYRQLDITQIINNARQAVFEKLDLEVYSLILVKPGGIPRTTSGKLQRQLCRTKFLENSLAVVASSTLAEPTPQPDALTRQELLASPAGNQKLLAYLQGRIADMVKRASTDIDPTLPLSSFGLDSLRLVELQHSLENVLEVELDLALFLQAPDLYQLAEALYSALETPRTVAEVTATEHRNFYPLTPGQRALWFLYKLAPNSTAYNISRAVRFEQDPEINALKKAVRALVQRHVSLRSVFVEQAGNPVSELKPVSEECFEGVDASGWTEIELNERLQQAADTPFVLETGPLIRFLLFKQTTGGSILLVSAHHIVADLWSLVLLFHELGKLYAESNLSNPTTDYHDYLSWQARMLAGTTGTKLQNYWLKQLGGELPVLNLPTDQPRPPTPTYRGASLTFSLPTHISTGLRTLAEAEKVSLYTLLLAGWQVLLYRYSRQADILVGSPMAARPHARFGEVVGYFANLVVLRANFSANPTFKQFLQQVNHTVQGGLEHQAYPFAALVEALHLSHPLIQVMFAFQQLPPSYDQPGLHYLAYGGAGGKLSSGGLELETVALTQSGAQFDLSLTMTEIEDGLAGELTFSTDLYDAATVERMLAHFQNLLEGIAFDPQIVVANLPLLSISEQQRITVEWNATEVPYNLELCLHQWFEAQVVASPQAIALSFGGQHLTYLELNQRANQLAHYLRSLGVRVDTPVAICMERSLEMVVGLLAILKAGGAYAPLEPDFPVELLRGMLTDLQSPVLLTHTPLLEISQKIAAQNTALVCLERDAEVIGQQPDTNPVVITNSRNLAYILYTSGSTGKPKGVMLEHRGVCNRLLWMQEQYSLTTSDSVLQKTAYSFDVSVWEFFWPLMIGARLVLAQPGGQRDSSYLAQTIQTENITTLHFVPSMLQIFLDEPELERCTSLKRVICSGEALPIETQAAFFARLPNVSLHNLYGPTEASIDVSYWACQPDATSRTVPIGGPIANIQLYITDEYYQPVPIGVAGELHIGGVGLARGYLNRPDLTAQKFVPDPFSPLPGARLYKTGDLARFRTDGNIEFLGRLDQQVKIRGFRVELGEIEACLVVHPAVREAVVMAVGSDRLIAYLLGDSKKLSSGELRAYLSGKLPEYMVPLGYVWVESWPLNANGKLDRKALAEKTPAATLQTVRLQPENEIEARIVEIWQTVLGISEVGVEDNFFELGGHSLLLAQVQNVLRRKWPKELSLSLLYQYPTIRALAVQLQHLNPLSVARPVLAPTQPKLTEAPLSYSQQPIFILSQLKSEDGFFHMTVGISWQQAPSIDIVEKALNLLRQRHEALRTVFVPDEAGFIMQRVRETLPVALVTNLTHQSLTEAHAFIQTYMQQKRCVPFSLETGPLWRIYIFELAQEQRIYLDVHHLIADGWSLGVMVAEFIQFCQTLAQGNTPDFQPLPVSYLDYVQWEQALLQSGSLQKQEQYWLSRFSPPPPPLELPWDKEPSRLHQFKGQTMGQYLEPDLSITLHQMSRTQGVSLNTLLLSAYLVWLHRISGQEDLVVGVPVAVREDDRLAEVVGCFVNVVPFRFQFEEADSLAEVVQRVHRNMLDALENKEYPYALLLEKLSEARRNNSQALYSTVFSFQNFPIPDFGQSIQVVELEPDANSKASLLWTLSEREGRLKCELTYDSELFEPESAARFLSQFTGVLQALAQASSQSIYDFELDREVAS